MNFFKKEKEVKNVDEEKKFTLNKEISEKLKEIKDVAVLKLQDPKVSLTIAGGSIVIAVTIASIAILGSKEKAPESVDMNASTSYSQNMEQEDINSSVEFNSEIKSSSSSEVSSVSTQPVEENHYTSNGSIKFDTFPEFGQVIEASYDNPDQYIITMSVKYPDKIVPLMMPKGMNMAFVLISDEENKLTPHFICFDQYVEDPTYVADYLAGDFVDFTQVDLTNSILVPLINVIDCVKPLEGRRSDDALKLRWQFDYDSLYNTLYNILEKKNITNEIVPIPYSNDISEVDEFNDKQKTYIYTPTNN